MRGQFGEKAIIPEEAIGLSFSFLLLPLKTVGLESGFFMSSSYSLSFQCN